MFRKIVMLVLLFVNIFSPFVLAQEELSAQEQEKAEAIKKGKADAIADTSKGSWFIVGACVPPAAALVGMTIGAAISSPTADVSFQESDYFGHSCLTASGSCSTGGIGPGLIIGTTGGVLIPVTIANSKVKMPPERLIGKSAEYVEAYGTTYMKQVKNIRVQWLLIGCGASSFFSFIFSGLL